MRYWTPLAGETAAAVEAFAPDEIVLLPLYPQYSTTTTASSLKDWEVAYRGPGQVHSVCCYPTAQGLIEAHVDAIRAVWDEAGRPDVRLLFSAHGLPQRIVDAGDPYAAQIAATAAAITVRIPELADWAICYQSRVGRLAWLAPSTEDEIRRAAADGKGVLITPVAFVSEHVETLVELDRDYAELAEIEGCAPYLRAKTPGVHASFIEMLARVVQAARDAPGLQPQGPWRCPAGLGKCGRRPLEAA